jgi:ABC-2 type transport system ATP-binding protein
MIKIRELKKEFREYGITIGCRIIDIESGRSLGIAGNSGSGKTIFSKMLSGLIRDYSGRIELDGISVKEIFRKKIGFSASDGILYDSLTVEEMLFFLSARYGLKKTEYSSRREWFSRYFDIGRIDKRKIATLTGGELQTVKFAAAVIHSPSLVIIDEPFNGLGEAGAESIAGLISGLKDQNVSVIALSSHKDLLMKITDETADIRNGEIG